MTRAPYVMLKPEAGYERGARTMEDTTLGWRFVNPRMQAAYPPISLGETAECVADAVDRVRASARTRSRSRASGGPSAAIDGGRFDGPARAGRGPGRKGAVTVVDRDEHPAPRRRCEALAGLKPAFRTDGTVTAGNSSGINDGAAALLLVEAGRAARARAAAAGAGRVDRRRRRRPGRHGHRPGAGRPQGAGPGRARGRRPGRRRAQRGVRVASRSPAWTSWGSTPRGSTRTAARSPWGIRWGRPARGS